MSAAAEAGTNWAAWLAAYAAAVATFVALRQMVLEQPSIRVVLYPNHELPGHPPMTALIVTNVGGRPLTVDFVAVLFRDHRPMGVPLSVGRGRFRSGWIRVSTSSSR